MARSLVALVSVGHQPGGFELILGRPDPIGLGVDRAGQRSRHSQSITVGLAVTCRFMPYSLCLPE